MSKQQYYCGPNWGWFPELLKRPLSYRFNASCKIHDLDYGSPKYSRFQADIRFLYHMMRQAEGSLFWELVAVLYFLAARVAGWLSWSKSDDDHDHGPGATRLPVHLPEG